MLLSCCLVQSCLINDVLIIMSQKTNNFAGTYNPKKMPKWSQEGFICSYFWKKQHIIP